MRRGRLPDGEVRAGLVQGLPASAPGALLAALVVAACSDSASEIDRADLGARRGEVSAEASANGMEAATLLAALEERFEVTVEARGDRLSRSSILARPPALHDERVRAELPARADQAVVLEFAEGAAKLSARVFLEGARAIPGVETSDLQVFLAAAGSRGDVLRRHLGAGFEEYVHFSERPTEERLTYRVELDGVAGVRAIGGTVELLDAAGTPRLRMSPPALVDAVGQYHWIDTSVRGCAFDDDPSPPWGRAVVPAGASACFIDLDWSRSSAAYPLLVDPLWTTTSTMVEARISPMAALPGGNRALVAGGRNAFVPLASAELYDHTTSTWSPVQSLPSPVRRHTLSALDLGEGAILLAGGCPEFAPAVATCTPSAAARLFNAATGTWVATGALSEPRSRHGAVVVGGARVMLIGGVGVDAGTNVPLASTDTWDAGSGVFTSGPAMLTPRADFGLADWEDGRVVVAGGLAAADGSGNPEELASAERYDPRARAWVSLPDAPVAVREPTLAPLGPSRMLFFGGVSLVTASSSSVFFDFEVGAWQPTPSTNDARWRHATAVLSSGWVLAAGGLGDSTSVELFPPDGDASSSWAVTEPLPSPRTGAAAVRLGSGEILLAGGQNDNDLPLATSVVLAPFGTSAPCAHGGECATGFCVDGVCCEEACAQPCRTCARAHGSPADGTCAPSTPDLLDPRGLCAVSDPCATTGACDANGTCALFAASTPCATCPTGGNGSCDGKGACVCSGAACTDPFTLQDAAGELQDCSPYLCSGSACATSCATSLECAEGLVCDRQRQCIPPPSSAAGGGCACGVRAPDESGPAWLLAVMAAGLVSLRRRFAARALLGTAGDRSASRARRMGPGRAKRAGEEPATWA